MAWRLLEGIRQQSMGFTLNGWEWWRAFQKDSYRSLRADMGELRRTDFPSSHADPEWRTPPGAFTWIIHGPWTLHHDFTPLHMHKHTHLHLRLQHLILCICVYLQLYVRNSSNGDNWTRQRANNKMNPLEPLLSSKWTNSHKFISICSP